MLQGKGVRIWVPGQPALYSETGLKKKKSNTEFSQESMNPLSSECPKFQLCHLFLDIFKENSGNDWNPC